MNYLKFFFIYLCSSLLYVYIDINSFFFFVYYVFKYSNRIFYKNYFYVNFYVFKCDYLLYL